MNELKWALSSIPRCTERPRSCTVQDYALQYMNRNTLKSSFQLAGEELTEWSTALAHPFLRRTGRHWNPHQRSRQST